MNKRLILMLTVVSLVFGGIFGFKWFGHYMMNQFFDSMEPEPATITVSTAQQVQWIPTAEAVGTFRATQGADLSTEVGGIVRAIHFSSGQRVSAGQRLLELDTEADAAELEQFEAALRLAELELTRHRRLFAQNSISEAEVERRASEVEQARAMVAAQQARIRQKILRAPFDGVVGIRQVDLGQYLSPGMPVVSLQTLNPIYLEFSLPEQRLALVQNGAPLQARVDAYSNQIFSGQITALEPRIRETTRTFQVQSTLANPEEKLRPGMFARVELSLGEAETLVVVPQTAIRFSTYGHSVFVLDENADNGENRVIQRFVRTGATRGDLIAITAGLEAGQQVASSGLLKLQNQARVMIDTDPNVRPSEDPDPRPANR